MTSTTTAKAVFDDTDLAGELRWWNAANYLTVGQIYLRDNALLRERLRAEHIKPRLLGHWGTSPGISLVYTALNRLIRATDCDCLLVTGPGHGGPALVANAYLDGTYSERYPAVTRDEAGLRQLFRQFSTPGGVPSHAGPQTPGSIHEGGELGYALAHAGGAVMDSPDLIAACIVGDGESETAPLAGSWRLPAFLRPGRDGAVLPILHVNGYKISGPTIFGRSSDDDIRAYLRSQGWQPSVVGGDDPTQVLADLCGALAASYERIREVRTSPAGGTPLWPAVILRTRKGWTGPARVDGKPIEGTFRAHQVPLANVRDDPAHLALLEEWLHSYRPEDLFDAHGALADDIARLAPTGDKRLSATPYADGSRTSRPLDLPAGERYALAVDQPGRTRYESTRPIGEFLRDIMRRNTRTDGTGDFRLFCPDETASNRLSAVFEVTDRCFQLPTTSWDENVSRDGRVLEVLSEHLCEGWLEGYTLTGRHGLFATYEAFAMVSASMLVQHAKWLTHANAVPWRAAVPSLNVLLTSTCWRNDHNGFSHQGPGLIDTAVSFSPEVVRVWLPPDANTALAVTEHCLATRNRVNLVVVDKQDHLQYLDYDAARRHVSDGTSIWPWAGTESATSDPDIVLAAAGDAPTQEVLAAADLLRHRVPWLRVRVVNVVDLMSLMPENDHPHGMADSRFDALFTEDRHVIFAFHGHPRVIHQLIHGRRAPERFHVRGFTEHGSTTTPFDMTVLNRMSRYHLVIEALRRSARGVSGEDEVLRHCHTMLAEHASYVAESAEDLPEISSWHWGAGAGSVQPSRDGS